MWPPADTKTTGPARSYSTHILRARPPKAAAMAAGRGVSGNVCAYHFVKEDTSTLLKYDIVNLDRDMQDELREAIYREGIVIYEEI